MDGVISHSSTDRIGRTIFEVENLAQKRIHNFDQAAAPFRKYRKYGAKRAAGKFVNF